VSSKTFDRLAKSLKTGQQSTSKCWKIKISINIKEEQKAPSETMLQVDNRLVIARKQVPPRTNVEEFQERSSDSDDSPFLKAISPPPGSSGKKIPLLKIRFLEIGELNFRDLDICHVAVWPLSPHRFLEKSTEQIFNYFRFSEKRSPTHISGTAEDTATKFDTGVGHGALMLPYQPQLNTSSGFGSTIFFSIFSNLGLKSSPSLLL
jgi:hypothetical protein